jgi:putative peptidoglycan lipid II flippase
MRDTRTPLRYALVRVGLTTVLGYFFAIPLPRWLGIPAVWGAAGLTMSAGIAGWVEMLMLRRTLNRRIGPTGLPAAYVVKLWLASASGAAMAWVIKVAMRTANPLIAAILILVPYGLVFFAVALLLRIPEASRTLGRLTPRPG